MLFRYEYQGGVWIDLERPTEDEVHEIAQEFSVVQRLEKEIVSPSPLPMVLDGDTAILLELQFPTQGAESDETNNQEVDIIVGKHFIITAHYEVVAPLHHLKKLFETRGLITGHESVTTDVLIEVLFAHLYASVHDHSNHITARLERVERDMFDGRERTTVRAISNISRAFLHLEADLANQEEPLNRFLKAPLFHTLFGDSFNERAARILEERTQLMHLVKTHRAIATEMRETNTALLESRQNEIMKTLTVITFIFLPLELITFVFGMGVHGTPFEQNPDAFWIITGSMLAISLLITIFLVRKRWIF